MALGSRISKDRLLTWTILTAPALGWGWSFAQSGVPIAEDALNPTGALSAILFILALLATPLRLVWSSGWLTVWLRRNRRYLGVASFAYALLHTIFYLLDAGSLAKVRTELPQLDIWTGWLALLIMLPLAVTSSNGWVRRLGPHWKRLQQCAYGAAILGFLHAISLNAWDDPWEPLIVASPLIALQVWRVTRFVHSRLKE